MGIDFFFQMRTNMLYLAILRTIREFKFQTPEKVLIFAKSQLTERRFYTENRVSKLEKCFAMSFHTYPATPGEGIQTLVFCKWNKSFKWEENKFPHFLSHISADLSAMLLQFLWQGVKRHLRNY